MCVEGKNEREIKLRECRVSNPAGIYGALCKTAFLNSAIYPNQQRSLRLSPRRTYSLPLLLSPKLFYSVLSADRELDFFFVCRFFCLFFIFYFFVFFLGSKLFHTRIEVAAREEQRSPGRHPFARRSVHLSMLHAWRSLTLIRIRSSFFRRVFAEIVHFC